MSEEIKKGESWRKGYMRGIKEKEQEIIILRSDIQRAIGFIQGLGYHDEYLEKKYNPVEHVSKDKTADWVCGCTKDIVDCFDCANDRHYACTGVSKI